MTFFCFQCIILFVHSRLLVCFCVQTNYTTLLSAMDIFFSFSAFSQFVFLKFPSMGLAPAEKQTDPEGLKTEPFLHDSCNFKSPYFPGGSKPPPYGKANLFYCNCFYSVPLSKKTNLSKRYPVPEGRKPYRAAAGGCPTVASGTDQTIWLYQAPLLQSF